MSNKFSEALDTGYKAIETFVEMIDACVEAHQQLWGKAEEPQPKSDHLSTFRDSLEEEE
jgi:hypothetical protein